MIRKFAVLLLLLLSTTEFPAAKAVAPKIYSFTAEVWADNWFAMYVNGKQVGQDSVPITTQRSFNSETIKFTASYPLTIGFIAKDYVQSSSGLEYLGTANQQIGDGGLIFQIRETVSQKLVEVSNETWSMKVANTAPINPECVTSKNPDVDCKYMNYSIPKTWLASTFSDKAWPHAKVFSFDEVGPKDGYFQIKWQASAKFIWGNDLKLDNVIYFRKKVLAPTAQIVTSALDFTVTSSKQNVLNTDTTCDGAAKSPGIIWSGVPITAKSLIFVMDTIPGPPRPGENQIGNHYYITQFNISPSKSGFDEGAITPYSPPCSQGPGVKEYRFFLFALDQMLPNNQKYDGLSLMTIGENQAIAKASHIYTYSRKG